MRIKDILMNAQRVNKMWQTAIKDSRKLQQALFFEPLSDTSPAVTNIRELRKCLDLKYSSRLTRFKEREIKRRMHNFTQMNPLLHNMTFARVDLWVTRAPLTGVKRLQGFSRMDASWRRMFLAQQPSGFTVEKDPSVATKRMGDLVQKGQGVKSLQKWLLESYGERIYWQRVQYAYEASGV